MKPLLYNTRPMKVEPINLDLSDIAQTLREGRAAVAELEPGDGTYYNLLLVPCDAPNVKGGFRRFGISHEAAHRYLLVVLVRDRRPDRAVFVQWDGVIREHDVVGLEENGWSQTFLAWWLNALREVAGVDVLDPVPHEEGL